MTGGRRNADWYGYGQPVFAPDTVVVHNGSVTLRGLLWRPNGRGPFPAILLNHGSGRSREELERLGPYEQRADTIGRVFARHGYVFLFLFRRGVGLSTAHDTNAVDLMNAEFAAHGQEARNTIDFLRKLPDVDPHDLALAHVQAPMFFIHAANDYSIAPGKALDARLQELGKVHRLKIYPPIGLTADDGHAFPIIGVPRWERDVFAFLDEYMRR